MDPIRNPYALAPDSDRELAGRDERRLRAFDVTLERVARGRPERSVVLTGLRGVGEKRCCSTRYTVSRGSGTSGGPASWRARPDQRLRRPLAAALHMAVREVGASATREVEHVLGVLKSFAQQEDGPRESGAAATRAGAGGRSGAASPDLGA